MSQQERNDKESLICLMSKPSQNFFVYSIQSKEKFLTENELFKEKMCRIEQKKQKEGFFPALAMVIKKDPTMSIRKHTNELKVHKKTEDSNKTRFKPRP